MSRLTNARFSVKVAEPDVVHFGRSDVAGLWFEDTSAYRSRGLKPAELVELLLGVLLVADVLALRAALEVLFADKFRDCWSLFESWLGRHEDLDFVDWEAWCVAYGESRGPGRENFPSADVAHQQPGDSAIPF
jgi:hypothetical protein